MFKLPQNKYKKVETNMYKDYITGQTALTLNLDFTIPNNHLATVIGWFVDSIPEEVLLSGDAAKTGRPAYHPAMMLKILLFAYYRRVFLGRKIELLLAEGLINKGAFFIDGTKIATDANRYWCKSLKPFLVALLKKPEDAVLISCFIS